MAAKGLDFSGDVSWAGFGYTYFFFGLVPENGAGHKVEVRQDGAALMLAINGPAATERATFSSAPKNSIL